MTEQQNIEYKQSWHDDYLKWVCGFANAQGGVVFIGKDDNENVVGIDDYKKLMDDIPNKIRNAIGIMVEVNYNTPQFSDHWLSWKTNTFTSKMKRMKRVFTSAFKAQVAIEALKERESLAELSKRFGLHPQMISKWKKEFQERGFEIFETKGPIENHEKEKERLFAKIGQLEVECDWLKKISKMAGQ